MAKVLEPVDSREVVRCDHCLLVQFRTTSSFCRRCHVSLDKNDPEIPIHFPKFATESDHAHFNIASSIRALRLRSGLSQRQLAARMSVPRVYVSKIENEQSIPSILSLERLARALGVSVLDLLAGGVRNREEEIRDLLEDEFIAAMIPFVTRLNGLQMLSLLTNVRDLTLHHIAKLA